MSSSLNQRSYSLLKCLLRVDRSPNAAVSLLTCHYTMKKRWSRLFFQKLCVHIKDNNSPRGKFHRFLFPFSTIFPDLNFALYALYIYLCYKNRMSHKQWAWVTCGQITVKSFYFLWSFRCIDRLFPQCATKVIFRLYANTMVSVITRDCIHTTIPYFLI